MQIHHINPLRSNGSHEWTNLIPLCENCHTTINSIDNLLNHKNSNLGLDNSEGFCSSIAKASVVLFGNVFGNFQKKKNKNVMITKEFSSEEENKGNY